MLAEPDMETLTHWVQRLEPLISAELDREIIVVFCNRCGQEEECLYAGTSAIIGIKGGEVNVYGLAGRGTKEFLMADTSRPPFAKLVQGEDELESPGLMTWPATPALPPAACSASANAIAKGGLAPANSITSACGGPPPPPPITTSNQPKRDRPSPKIQIPDFGTHSFSGGSNSRMDTVSESPNTIPTPEAPSPTPLAIRPQLIAPQTEAPSGDSRKPSPYPHDDILSQQYRSFGRQHHPLTPFPHEQDPAQAKYYWRPSDTLLNTPLTPNWICSPDPDGALKVDDLGSLTPHPASDLATVSRSSKHFAKEKGAPNPLPPISERPDTSLDHKRSNSGSCSAGTHVKAGPDEGVRAESLETSEVPLSPQRASSPEQRSQSKSRSEGESDLQAPKHSNESPTSEQITAPVGRPGPVSPGTRPSWPHGVRSIDYGSEPRPQSPKSRNASRNRSRTGSTTREYGSNGRRPSEPPANGVQRGNIGPRNGPTQPPSHGEEIKGADSHTADDVDGDRGRSRAPSVIRHTAETSSPGLDGAAQAQSSDGRLDEKRPISRGRQRWTARDPPPPYSETDNNRLLIHVQVEKPLGRAQATSRPAVPRQVSITRIQSASGLVGVRFATPDDEIIAIEEYIDPVCNMHSKRSASTSAISHKIPSIEDGRAIVGVRSNLPPPPPVSALDLTDSFDDGRVTVFRTPSVLGGSVKTTIIEVPNARTRSGVSILTPPLSAVSEMMTPASPPADLWSSNYTPSALKFDLTPQATAVVHLAAASMQMGRPSPLLTRFQCNDLKSVDGPLKTGPLDCTRQMGDDAHKALLSGLAVTAPLLKRRSW